MSGKALFAAKIVMHVIELPLSWIDHKKRKVPQWNPPFHDLGILRS